MEELAAAARTAADWAYGDRKRPVSPICPKPAVDEAVMCNGRGKKRFVWGRVKDARDV